jgi:pimeloyl-ACP methyl ester carboxylesterase
MTKITPTYGITGNDIPYARLGSGTKTLQVWYGGPGTMMPKGIMFAMISKGLEPFLEEYTVTLLSRRTGISEGYTTQNMSEDYAELIKAEYGGHVDLIIGVSYGGIVVQHFAADHPDLCNRIVICMAAYEVSEYGKQLDYRFAELLNQNKPRQAWPKMAEVLVESRFLLAITRLLLWLLGPMLLGDTYTEVYRRDVLIEAKAEIDHDGTESLQRIKIPTLIQGGDNDHYFPVDYFKKTAALIPNAVLKIYPGKGHNLLEDHQTANDILAWVAGGLE